jgi:hypothetical protein
MIRRAFCILVSRAFISPCAKNRVTADRDPMHTTQPLRRRIPRRAIETERQTLERDRLYHPRAMPGDSVNFFGLAQAGQQAVEFTLDDAVAFAGARFEAFTIENLDAATAVMNQAGVMQLARGFRDTFATHTEHIGDQLLGDLKLVRRSTVDLDQQPAAQLLVERVMTIAGRRLRDLREQCLHVQQH